VLRPKRYERSRLKIFRRNSVSLAQNFRYKGSSPSTILRVAKLAKWIFYTVKNSIDMTRPGPFAVIHIDLSWPVSTRGSTRPVNISVLQTLSPIKVPYFSGNALNVPFPFHFYRVALNAGLSIFTRNMSVCQARALWQNERKTRSDFYTIRTII